MKTARTTILLTTAFLATLVTPGCQPETHEDEASAATEVAVQVGKVTRATLRAVVEAYGVVEPAPATPSLPAAQVRISAPVPGLLAEAKVIEGQRVERGARLFTLDDRLARAAAERARQTVEKARQAARKTEEAVKFARQALAREKTLMAQQNTSVKRLQEVEQQLAAAEAEFAAAKAEQAVAGAELASAETQLSLLHIEAPMAGTVVRVLDRPGQTVDPATVLAELIDLDRLVLAAKVPAVEAVALKAGQTAELLAERASRNAIQGKVIFISPQVDAGTATVLVRVSVPPGAGLRPGQFLHVRVITEERPRRLAVPRESVYTDHDGQSTLSIVEGDRAKQKAVKIGLRDGNLVEVEGEGVTEGATVVTLGSYALPKETKVRILNPQQEAK